MTATPKAGSVISAKKVFTRSIHIRLAASLARAHHRELSVMSAMRRAATASACQASPVECVTSVPLAMRMSRSAVRHVAAM